MEAPQVVQKISANLAGGGFLVTVEYLGGEAVKYKRLEGGTIVTRAGSGGEWAIIDSIHLPYQVAKLLDHNVRYLETSNKVGNQKKYSKIRKGVDDRFALLSGVFRR